jgi:hypothetical protein
MDQNDPACPDDTIIERREIRFSAGALRGVIGGLLDVVAPFGRPPVLPVRITLMPAENQVDVFYGEGETARPLPLRTEALGALLIAYCMRVRIPMRRVARKEVRIGAAYVALVLHVEYPQALEPKVIETPVVQRGSAMLWRLSLAAALGGHVRPVC